VKNGMGGRTVLIGLLIVGLLRGRVCAEDTSAGELRQIQLQIQKIKTGEERERERNEKLIERLEQKVDRLEAQNQRLETSNKTLQTAGVELQAQTREQLAQIQEHWPASQPQDFAQEFQNYLGEHQFTLAGGAAGSFIYDRQAGKNTFNLLFEPILFYRLNDWILFEGTIEADLPPGSDASFQLPVATAQIFLNDYMEINAGIFDQPFGDFYEDQSPVWVNRFVTAPLPYGVEALVPPTDVGVQLRGGLQWGTLGQDLDYTVWVANGPGFDSSLPQQVVGEVVNPVNNIGINTNGRAFGARLRGYPFPLDSNLGRLEIGASTLDGKWLDGNWYNAWGVDFAYLKGSLQARGEFLEMYRQMPNANADNRQGWYVQLGYFLNGLSIPDLPAPVEDVAHRLELLVRYSGVNQRAVVQDEISTIPAIGFNGSPSIFTPHAREVALGLDYWIAPSIVLQNEVDFELPEAGGSVISFDGNSTPTTRPQGATPNDVAFLTQLAIGF
jgi:exonuclease VII small subunit